MENRQWKKKFIFDKNNQAMSFILKIKRLRLANSLSLLNMSMRHVLGKKSAIYYRQSCLSHKNKIIWKLEKFKCQLEMS